MWDYLLYFSGTPFSPLPCVKTQGMERTGGDSVGLSIVLLWDSVQSPGLSTVPGDLKDVQWRHGTVLANLHITQRSIVLPCFDQ